MILTRGCNLSNNSTYISGKLRKWLSFKGETDLTWFGLDDIRTHKILSATSNCFMQIWSHNYIHSWLPSPTCFVLGIHANLHMARTPERWAVHCHCHHVHHLYSLMWERAFIFMYSGLSNTDMQCRTQYCYYFTRCICTYKVDIATNFW